MIHTNLDRTVTVYRDEARPTGGVQDYGGKTVENLVKVLGPVAASVQSRNTGRANPTDLPGDVQMGQWRIFIRDVVQAPPGSIKNRDVVRDDLGRQFTVTNDYCHRHGWTLSVDRAEL